MQSPSQRCGFGRCWTPSGASAPRIAVSNGRRESHMQLGPQRGHSGGWCWYWCRVHHCTASRPFCLLGVEQLEQAWHQLGPSYTPSATNQEPAAAQTRSTHHHMYRPAVGPVVTAAESRRRKWGPFGLEQDSAHDGLWRENTSCTVMPETTPLFGSSWLRLLSQSTAAGICVRYDALSPVGASACLLACLPAYRPPLHVV